MRAQDQGQGHQSKWSFSEEKVTSVYWPALQNTEVGRIKPGGVCGIVHLGTYHRVLFNSVVMWTSMLNKLRAIPGLGQCLASVSPGDQL